MHVALTTLLDRLDSPAAFGTDVIPWGAPVPVFGDLARSRVATLGLNPSNREFVDEVGTELRGDVRRFHTLDSLGLTSWADADASHINLIIGSCRQYFSTNPYDQWFRRLDKVLEGANVSYYAPIGGACHLDLIPYATSRKWTSLTSQERLSLNDIANGMLPRLLRDSDITVLILNGQSVVNQFQRMSAVVLAKTEMPTWSLGRLSGRDVMGVAYQATVRALAGYSLNRPLLVLGFNHNLQSSFGVTSKVIAGIRDWVAEMMEGSPAD